MIMQFFVVIITVLLLDYLWLKLFMKNFYQGQLKSQLKQNPNYFSAGIVYILLAIGIVFFVLRPTQTVSEAMAFGALFGFVVYGVYDFTNNSVLHDYGIKVSLVDLVWGTFLCGSAALAARLVAG